MSGEAPAAAAPEPAIAAPAAAEPAAAPDAAATSEGQGTPEEKRERQLTQMARRYQDLERQHRKALKEQKELAEKFSALDKRLGEDPYGLLKERGVGSKEWAKAFLDQEKPEDQIPDAFKARLEQLETHYKTQAEREQQAQQQAQEQQFNAAIAQAMEQREDLAFSAKLGQAELVAKRIRSHQSEYGSCTREDQEQIALQVESETRKAVSDLLAKMTGVPGFADMLRKHLEGAPKTSDSPAGSDKAKRASPASETGKAQGTNAKRKALTRAQAAQVTARQASGGLRDRAASRAAALKRLEERTRERAL